MHQTTPLELFLDRLSGSVSRRCSVAWEESDQWSIDMEAQRSGSTATSSSMVDCVDGSSSVSGMLAIGLNSLRRLHPHASWQTMRPPRLRDFSQSLRHRRPLDHSGHPRLIFWMLLHNTIMLAELLQQTLANAPPSDKRQVGVSALVADEPSGAVAFEAEVKDTRNAIDLVDVAVDGGLDLFRMEACEPGCLAGVGCLT